MTTAVQHRRGTTAEHAAFTGLEGEVTIDTTKDTAVIHDGTLAGGYPLAKENLANVTTSGLSSIDGASTASDDKFFIFDQSATSLKTITRAELNNAIEQDALANVAITGGTINGTAIGGTTPAAGAFTTLSASGAATLSGLTASTALALDGSKNIVSVTNTGTGSNVLATSPTLITPALGTPSALVGTNITGTATSFNINGTVGATTPASGAFTTLAASGAVTLSGGTANGVAYLNGSKVVTSGSALTFDGSNLVNGGNFSTGTSGLATYFRASGTAYTQIGDNQTLGAGTAFVIGSSTPYLAGNVGGSEGMRLTSTGLGIGTSSPAAKLHIGGNTASTQQAIFTTGVTDSDFKVVARNGVSGATAVQGYIGLDYANGTWPLLAGMQFIRNSTSGELAFTAGATTSASEQMRLTSTGLGIGTSSPAYKLDVVGTIQATGSGGAKVRLTDNTVSLLNSSATASGYLSFKRADGTQKAAVGSYYNVADEGNLEFVGPTGSTNMLLNSSGNLGLGVTPSAWDAAVYKALQISTNSSIASFTNGETRYSSNCFYNSSTWKYITSSQLASAYTQGAGAHTWFTAPSGTAGNAITFTQAMTLDASGRLGIGTTSPAVKLDVAGGSSADVITIRGRTSDNFGLLSFATSAGTKNAYIGSTDSTNLVFYTNGFTERARIDSSGNLLLGTTTAGAKFTLEYVGTSAVGQNINDSANTTNSTLMQFLIQGTQAGTIKRVGTTSAVVYNTTSDYRLKTVTGDVTGQGARIDALKPVDYLWKDGNQQARGFLAHEFQTVYPSSVSGDKDAVDADGNPVYQAMQAATSEVIADLVAEIKALRQRVAQLEAQ